VSAAGGGFADGVHRYPFRVHFDATDAAGVAYHAEYLAFADHARAEWMHGLPAEAIAPFTRNGYALAARRAEIDWRAPARPFEALEIVSALETLRRASLVFIQTTERAGTVLCRIRIELVCVDPRFRATRLPPAFDAAIRSHFLPNAPRDETA